MITLSCDNNVTCLTKSAFTVINLEVTYINYVIILITCLSISYQFLIVEPTFTAPSQPAIIDLDRNYSHFTLVKVLISNESSFARSLHQSCYRYIPLLCPTNYSNRSRWKHKGTRAEIVKRYEPHSIIQLEDDLPPKRYRGKSCL